MPRKTPSSRPGRSRKSPPEAGLLFQLVNLASRVMNRYPGEKNPAFARLLPTAVQALKADAGLITLFDSQQKSSALFCSYRLPPSLKRFSSRGLEVSPLPLISLDYPSHPRALPELVRAGVKQFFRYPLTFRNQPLGTLELYRFRSRPGPSPGQLRSAATAARLTAAALGASRVIDEGEEHLARLRTLREVAISISAELDLDRLLNLIIRKGMELLHLESGGIETWDEKLQGFRITHVVNMPENLRGLLVPPAFGLTARILKSRGVTAVQHYSRLRRTLPEIRELGYQALIGAPIKVEGKIFGNLILNSRESGRKFTPAERNLISLLAEHASVAVGNAQLLQNQKRYQARLHQLSNGIISAQEEERRRIARKLHDDFGQSVTAIKLRFDLMKKKWGRDLPAPLRKEITQIDQILSRTIQETRRLITDFRPTMLDDLGLIPTLRWRISRFKEETGIATRLSLPDRWSRLPAPIETALYRVIQETLANAARHSAATRVRIRLERKNKSVAARVEDNGIGFEVGKILAGNWEAVGLMAIEERISLLGGKTTINSRPGQGTRIRVEIPLNPNDN